MNFNQIFEEYFSIFRGQATNIPVSTDREYVLAIQLANNAIRKWERADGVQWPELWTTLQEENPTTVDADTATYDIDDMQQPPGYVSFTDSSNNVSKHLVVNPWELKDYGANQIVPYFTGNPNGGYTMHLDGTLDNYDGYDIDFPYLKKATLITNGNSVPDMSDVNFMIQDMLASRFMNTRNSFGYNAAKADASQALINMKLKASSGTYGNSSRELNTTAGWGKRRAGKIRDI